MKKEKKKKGIIKHPSVKQHYIRTILNYDKYDNIVEEIIKEKMSKKGVKR
jgi:desulfoferrodoxin (superoxide reductase-like protein)